MPNGLETPETRALGCFDGSSPPEGGGIPDELSAILDRITPERLNQRLDELSSIHSRRSEYGPQAYLGDDFLEKPIGEGGSREAFTDADFRARELLESWVEEILKARYQDAYTPPSECFTQTARIRTYIGGITVEQNPAGTIVTYAPESTDENQPAVAFGSHIDTVKEAGRHDGQDGIAAGICLLEALIACDAKTARPMKFVAVTGEESGKVAFSGSQILACGLDETQLDTIIEIGRTLRDGLTSWAVYFHIPNFDSSSLVEPLIKKDEWEWHLELHPHPTKEMRDAKVAVAPAEKLMGARRSELALCLAPAQATETPTHWGEEQMIIELAFETCPQPEQAKVEISLHTGSVTMDSERRRDVLAHVGFTFPRWLETVRIDVKRKYGVEVDIADIVISNQALNIIPHKIKLKIVFHGDDGDKVAKAAHQYFNQDDFCLIPFTTTALTNRVILCTKKGYDPETQPEEYQALQAKTPYPRETLTAALNIICLTRELGLLLGQGAQMCEERYTATVSTLRREEDKIILGTDIRATDQIFLGLLSYWIYRGAEVIARNHRLVDDIVFFSGSADPVILDANLTNLIQETTARLQGETVEAIPKLVIPAGEDASIISRLCRCGMVFVASNGICHGPKEQVDPNDLVMGVKTHLSSVWQLGKGDFLTSMPSVDTHSKWPIEEFKKCFIAWLNADRRSGEEINEVLMEHLLRQRRYLYYFDILRSLTQEVLVDLGYQDRE